VLVDARAAQSGTELCCDICIVGAGPAGIAIANRLRDSGLQVLLLESGGFKLEYPTQSLYRGEIDGDRYFRLDACRWRMFGGSSNRWGGWCRPLEACDFTARDWIPYSGWPISAKTLKPYEADAAELCQLPNASFDLAAWRDRFADRLDFAGQNFQNTVFQHSPETNFGEVYRARLVAATNVTTMLHANLLEMRLDRDSCRIASLQVGTLTGRRFTVRPKAVVLAAGGIENARLLLASRTDRPAGLGNEFDLVGRHFMEHLHMPLGHLLVARGAGDNHFYRKVIFDDVRLRGVLTPTPAAQERHRLLATSIAIEPPSFSLGTPFVGWPPRLMVGPVRFYRLLRARGLPGVAERLKQVVQRVYSVPARVDSWRSARRARSSAPQVQPTDRIYSLYFRGEQAPDPANRIVLSERRDALGMPESRLEWRIKPIDAASMTSWLGILDQEARARGIGRVIEPREGWQDGFTGGPHHMGATRMAADPRHGVVDAHCRVHSVDNLYIAGSSVFATGGYANPTFALVTLALRLADTLQQRLRSSRVTTQDAATLETKV
jgi:choline dehydrogenase-like flavoprotein